VSDTWRSYQKNQLDVLRPNIDRRQFHHNQHDGLV
jgi:hypothetical protein